MNGANATLPETVDEIRHEIEVLERRLRLLHREVERDEPLPETVDILHCTTGNAHVGVPLANIERVVGIARLCPSNDAQSWMRGLLDIRGVMVPVIDVGMRIGNPPRVVELGDLIVMITLRHARVEFGAKDADGEPKPHMFKLGLWVASVLGVTRIQTATLDRNVPELMGAPYLLGVAVVNGHATYLLRSEALLEMVDLPTQEA